MAISAPTTSSSTTRSRRSTTRRCARPFAHALDRDTIMANIIKRQGMPAYSYLMPGFPGRQCRRVSWRPTPTNIEQAKQLLADAGYPKRGRLPLDHAVAARRNRPCPNRWAQAYASTLRDQLGQSTSKSPTCSFTDFMSALNARPHPAPVSACSLMAWTTWIRATCWASSVSGGRHTWSNEQFRRAGSGSRQLHGRPGRAHPALPGSRKGAGRRCRRRLGLSHHARRPDQALPDRPGAGAGCQRRRRLALALLLQFSATCSPACTSPTM
jgi:hypothetical protein